MRVVDPSVRNAVEICQSVFRVCPQTSLQSIRCGASVPFFADIISLAIVEPIDGMLAAMPFLFIPYHRYSIPRFLVVEYEDITSLLLFVVNQGQYINLPKIRESGALQNTPDGLFICNLLPALLQRREHFGILVRGQL